MAVCTYFGPRISLSSGITSPLEIGSLLSRNGLIEQAGDGSKRAILRASDFSVRFGLHQIIRGSSAKVFLKVKVRRTLKIGIKGLSAYTAKPLQFTGQESARFRNARSMWSIDDGTACISTPSSVIVTGSNKANASAPGVEASSVLDLKKRTVEPLGMGAILPSIKKFRVQRNKEQ